MSFITQGNTNWKPILIVVVLAVIVGGGTLWCVEKQKASFIELPEVEDSEEVAEESIQLPNPASFYCEQQGGILEIREMIGGQRGFCLFDDGSECDEWKFFNSECKKGDVFCRDLRGDGICQEIVCMAIGCPCAETKENCPRDCEIKTEVETNQEEIQENLKITDFTTDKKTYTSNEGLEASLTVLSSKEIKGVVIKLTGIKPHARSYINGSQTVDLNLGENKIVFTEKTPYCTSGCGGVYPGPYDLNIEIFIKENLIASSTVSINLTAN